MVSANAQCISVNEFIPRYLFLSALIINAITRSNSYYNNNCRIKIINEVNNVDKLSFSDLQGITGSIIEDTSDMEKYFHFKKCKKSGNIEKYNALCSVKSNLEIQNCPAHTNTQFQIDKNGHSLELNAIVCCRKRKKNRPKRKFLNKINRFLGNNEFNMLSSLSDYSTINRLNHHGFSPLHVAAINNNKWALKKLTNQFNAHINIKDTKGKTPLIHAAVNGYKKVVQSLVNLNANQSITDVDDNTALFYAQFNGHKEIEALLTDKQMINEVHNNAIKAVKNEDHSLATERELLNYIKSIHDYNVDIDKKKALFRNLFSGVNPINWNVNPDSVILTSQSYNNHNLIISNMSDDDHVGEGLFIIGEQGSWRYAALSQNIFANNNNTIDSSNLLKNVIYWLLKDYKSKRYINVLSSQIYDDVNFGFDSYQLRRWFQTYFRWRYKINSPKSCDTYSFKACIDRNKPDLIVFGNKQYNRSWHRDLVEGINTAIQNNIPFIVMHIKSCFWQPSSLVIENNLLPYMKITAHDNFWRHHRVNNLTFDDIIDYHGDYDDNIGNLIDTLSRKDFDPRVLTACNAVSYWSCFSKQFVDSFRRAADSIKDRLAAYDKKNINPFDTNNSFIKAILILADKYRSSIDYPIYAKDNVQFLQALFADWCVSYSRDCNLAQPDLGEHIVSKDQVRKGDNADFTYPETIKNETRIFNFKDYSEGVWTTSGWYALPGVPVTLSREYKGSSIPIEIKFNYAHPDSTSVKYGGYRRPIFTSTAPFSINSGETITFSTPYGGPLYFAIGDEKRTLSTAMTISGAAHHPAIMDPEDSVQVARFQELLENTEIPHWDIPFNNYEFHGRKDRLINSVHKYYEGNSTQLLESIKLDHIEGCSFLSGFSLPGKTVQESNSAFVMGVCNDLIGESLCNNKKLHTRNFIQHANFDQYTKLGYGNGYHIEGASGNPWDTTIDIQPAGSTANHELGHELQVRRLNIGYTQTPDDWSNFHSRASEVSNEMFPYYVMWNFFYNRKGHTSKKKYYRSSGKKTFSFIMSDILNLKNSDGDRVIVDDYCKVISQGETRHEAMFRGDAYAEHRLYRMHFYVQLMLRTQGMEFRNGMINQKGYELIPLLYLLERSFGKVTESEVTWEANKIKFGFELFPYSGHAIYGGSNIRNIPGNDWLLVVLSYLTQYNWVTQFQLFGLKTSSLAQLQAKAHSIRGDLPTGFYVLNYDMPPSTWTDGLDWLPISLDDKSTVWPEDGFSPNTCSIP